MNTVKWHPDEIAWVAGLLEGEGYFSRSANRVKWNRYEVGCGMTDEDVIRKLHRHLGVGRVVEQRRQRPSWKPVWRWLTNKNAEVYAICAAIHPFMGKRRRTRIEDIMRGINRERSLDELHEWRVREGLRVSKLRKPQP